MTQKKLSFPKQWEDWASWILGIWLTLSPWALFFENEPTAVRNAVVLGLLIILTEVVELSVFRDWEEWINIVLGIWLVASPWALGIASTAARWNFIVVGALVLVLALHQIRNMRSDPDEEITLIPKGVPFALRAIVDRYVTHRSVDAAEIGLVDPALIR